MNADQYVFMRIILKTYLFKVTTTYIQNVWLLTKTCIYFLISLLSVHVYNIILDPFFVVRVVATNEYRRYQFV